MQKRLLNITLFIGLTSMMFVLTGAQARTVHVPSDDMVEVFSPVDGHPIWIPRPTLPPPPDRLYPAGVYGSPEANPSIEEEKPWVPIGPPPPVLPSFDGTIGGMTQEQAEEIYKRHEEDFLHLPDVYGISLTAQGIIVEVKDPTSVNVPTSIEGLPVQVKKGEPQYLRSHTNTQ